MRGAVALVRMAEPVGQHAVLGDAVEHAVGADDRGVDRAGQNQEADEHDEDAERQPHRQRPDHVHRQPADQVVAVLPIRTPSGMIITAKNEISEVISML